MRNTYSRNVVNIYSYKVLYRQLVSQTSNSSIPLDFPKLNPKLSKLSLVDKVRGYFRYRKARSIEERENRDISILDKISILTKSLENQVVCVGRPLNASSTSTSESFHPLWLLSSDVKIIATRSNPKNVSDTFFVLQT